MGDLELALALDEGLVGTVDHDVADGRIGEQFLERAQAEQLVDQHLFERKLLAAVEGDLELGQNFADDRAEFFGKLVLAERRRRFRIDPFQQSRENLLLDPVDRSLEAFGLGRSCVAARILAIVEPVHRTQWVAWNRACDRVKGSGNIGGDIDELGPGAALHRSSHAERRALCVAAAHAASFAECVHRA